MAFTFNEIPNSRSETTNPPSMTFNYKASGEFDNAIVMAYALGATPGTVYTLAGALYRQDVRLEPDGWAQYQVTVPYAPRKKDSISWTFDTTGGTINVKCGKEHIADYPGTFTANPHKGAIGVKGDDIEGADIVIPALKYAFTVRHPTGVLSIAYSMALAAYTGRTNSASFGPFAAGELLYAGASGSDGTDTEAECVYNIVAIANQTGLSIGTITGIAKKGHDVLWIEFAKDVDGDGRAATLPERVFIERVYDAVNFASLFGWSL